MSGFLGTAPPPSQKAGDRPISFVLEVNGRVASTVTLALRPEDFSRTDPSRVTVHHTLAGAWADNFGPGLASIQISGTTGWRGGADGDGETRWKALRDNVFAAWHQRRKDAIAAGRDPAMVKLIYADALNDFAAEVAPLNLSLRRSRSRPLLIQYSMALTVLDQNDDQIKYLTGAAARGPLGADGGFFAGVMAALRTIRAAIRTATQWVQANIVRPVAQFLALANGIFAEVIGITRDVTNLTASALAVPTMLAQTGLNAFRTMGAVAGLPAQVRAQYMQVSGAFASTLCFLLAGRSRRRAYPDYAALYGASGCSSISGGRPVSPLAGTNAWTALPSPPGVPGLAVSPAAQASMRTVATSDPVLRPQPVPALATHLGTIATGIVYRPTAAQAAA